MHLKIVPSRRVQKINDLARRCCAEPIVQLNKINAKTGWDVLLNWPTHLVALLLPFSILSCFFFIWLIFLQFCARALLPSFLCCSSARKKVWCDDERLYIQQAYTTNPTFLTLSGFACSHFAFFSSRFSLRFSLRFCLLREFYFVLPSPFIHAQEYIGLTNSMKFFFYQIVFVSTASSTHYTQSIAHSCTESTHCCPQTIGILCSKLDS